MSTRARASSRLGSGYSLLEMLAVLALLGLLAVVAAGALRPETFAALRARGDARRLAVDLMQARARAIASGDNHLLVFQENGSTVVGYAIHRRLPDSTVPVDSVREFSDMVTVTLSAGAPEFDFEGAALAGGSITLAGPGRTWQVTVLQATGAVEVGEL